MEPSATPRDHQQVVNLGLEHLKEEEVQCQVSDIGNVLVKRKFSGSEKPEVVDREASREGEQNYTTIS